MKRPPIVTALPAALAGLILSAAAALAQAPAVPSSGNSAPAAADSVAGTVELEARVHALEEKLAAQSAALARAPRVEAGTGGFRVSAPDDAFVIRFRGYVQEDGRFFGADAPAGNSTFLLRRVRPILEGTVFRYYDFRVMTDFGEGKVSLQDAYADVHFVPWLRVRAGKFKPPVGLERLQSATSLDFVERGFVSSLVPNRDVGVQLWGDLAGGAVGWAAGVFDGVPDGASADADSENGKDLAGRIFVEPFRSAGVSPLKGLGAGHRRHARHPERDDERPRAPLLQVPGASSPSSAIGATERPPGPRGPTGFAPAWCPRAGATPGPSASWRSTPSPRSASPSATPRRRSGTAPGTFHRRGGDRRERVLRRGAAAPRPGPRPRHLGRAGAGGSTCRRWSSTPTPSPSTPTRRTLRSPPGPGARG